MLRRVAALAAALAAAPLALAADTATVRAQVGRTYLGTIAGAGDSHVIQLDDFALPGNLLTISLKADKSDLEPDLSLESPTALDLTPDLIPFRKDRSTSVTVKKFPGITADGRYLLRVSGKNASTGAYKLKITSKVARSAKGTGTVPGVAESNTITVYCPTDAVVKLKVKRTLGELQPEYGVTYRSDGLATPLAISTKPGQASFVAPASGDQTIAVNGAGSTEGTFKWSASMKFPRPPKTPIRVNGSPDYYPGQGPLPAKAVVTSGQEIRGIETDGVELAWREVRTSGGGPNANKNSIEIAKVTGSSRRNLANNFATDGASTARNFAMGPLEVAVVAEDSIFHAPRAGTGDELFATGVGAVFRVLASRDFAYWVRTDAMEQFEFADGDDSGMTLSTGTVQDACIGGTGIVYAVLQGGDVEVYTQTEAGTGDDLVGDLGAWDMAKSVAARGRDVFVVVDDAGEGTVYRVDALGILAPTVVFTSTNPLTSLAVDDANVYVIEDDATDGGRIVQIPRGGGVRQVLVRDNMTGSFTIDQGDLAAAGGYVYFVADVSGSDTILRVKRTK